MLRRRKTPANPDGEGDEIVPSASTKNANSDPTEGMASRTERLTIGKSQAAESSRAGSGGQREKNKTPSNVTKSDKMWVLSSPLYSLQY